MKDRKLTETEKKRVLHFCELILLFVASIIVNFKLAEILLLAMPVIIPIILGIKEKNVYFFEDNKKQTNITTR